MRQKNRYHLRKDGNWSKNHSKPSWHSTSLAARCHDLISAIMCLSLAFVSMNARTSYLDASSTCLYICIYIMTKVLPKVSANIKNGLDFTSYWNCTSHFTSLSLVYCPAFFVCLKSILCYNVQFTKKFKVIKQQQWINLTC